MMTSIKILRLIPLFALVAACIDPINIDRQETADIIIVDGLITDEPGPYVVKITHTFALDTDSSKNRPVAKAKIVLHSDKGEEEDLEQVKPGLYQTGGKIRGTVGTTYYIDIQMPDGSTFRSEPELMNPPGEIRKIKYEFEHRTTSKPWGVVDADVFNIFLDADASVSEDELSYMRWRFTGTYKVETNPEKHTTTLQGFTFKTPYECSGWVVDPGLNGGILRQDTICTCCTCWAEQFDAIPRLSDSELVSQGQFRNVKVGEAPITRMTFLEKYHVAIEQMAITKNAFDFLKIIRNQKENTANLFQPPPGTLVGNIKPVSASYNVIGLFSAASITRDAIFILKSDLPYKLPRDTVPLPCTAYPNSSTVKPDFWDE